MAAGLALVLFGYLLGRLQGGSADPAAAAAVAGTSADSPGGASSPDAASDGSAPGGSASAAPSPSTAPSSDISDGVDAYSVMQAEDAAGQQGTEAQETEDEGGGRNVGWIGNGDWLRFDDVEFGDRPATRFTARIASESDDRGGRVEIRIDSPGNAAAGALTIQSTGGWQKWETRTAAITPVTGRHTVFITFAREGDGEFVNLNHFSFDH